MTFAAPGMLFTDAKTADNPPLFHRNMPKSINKFAFGDDRILQQ
jgi:hypothetical protein